MIQRAGATGGIPFGVHVHMLRHACGYALANKGMDTRKLQHYSATPPSPTRCGTPR
jgi:site-specific recombinase XerD